VAYAADHTYMRTAMFAVVRIGRDMQYGLTSLEMMQTKATLRKQRAPARYVASHDCSLGEVRMKASKELNTRVLGPMLTKNRLMVHSLSMLLL